jgi:lysophospholipase L1-like esterase
MTANAYMFSIVAYGGTHIVDNFKVDLDDKKGSDYLVIGDSIAKGKTSDSISNRYLDIIAKKYNVSTVVNAGSSNVLEDINTDEVLSLEPKNIIIAIGINNLQEGDTASQLRTKMSNFVTIFTTAGYVVGTDLFILFVTPHTAEAAEIATYNGYLATDYGSACIDVYTEANDSGSMNTLYSFDTLHPNTLYHSIMADNISNYLGISQRNINDITETLLRYSENGAVQLASKKYRGGTPETSQLDVINENKLGVHVSIDNTSGGGYFFPLSDSGCVMSAGAYREVSTWYATATTATIIILTGGSISLYYNAGLTPGDSFSPTRVQYISNDGTRIGDSAVPTAYLDVKAGTASRAQIKLDSSVAPTSPNDGDIWFDGTDLKMRIAGITKTFTLV